MIIRARLHLKDLLRLFVCGIVIGATINIISTPNEFTETEVINSTDLFDKVKIYCFVLTTESHHKDKAIHVKNTWGSRCNKLIFASNVTDVELGSVKLTEDDQYDLLWGKTKNALIHAYANYFNDYDWFFKADDDTFAIMDNLRYMLLAYSPNDPIYLGKKLKTVYPLGFLHGGPGYVMSKTALRKFVTEAVPDGDKCYRDGDGSEDGNVCYCLRNVGACPGDARDKFRRERFLPLAPEEHLFSLSDYWYRTHRYYSSDEGLDCCSNYTISFHHIPPNMMYLLHYLVFNLQAYGVRHTYDPMPEKQNFTNIVRRMFEEVNTSNVLEHFEVPPDPNNTQWQ